jgi:hypothetical protein
MNFCLLFFAFRPVRVNVTTEDIYSYLLSVCEFRKNELSESRVLLTGVNEFLSFQHL